MQKSRRWERGSDCRGRRKTNRPVNIFRMTSDQLENKWEHERLSLVFVFRSAFRKKKSKTTRKKKKKEEDQDLPRRNNSVPPECLISRLWSTTASPGLPEINPSQGVNHEMSSHQSVAPSAGKTISRRAFTNQRLVKSHKQRFPFRVLSGSGSGAEWSAGRVRIIPLLYCFPIRVLWPG